MKKLAIAFGALFGLLLLTAIVVPLVVDVDKYRPQIVSKAGEYLNGKLELGKLGLSLWGRVHVSVDGLKLSDAKGRAVVEVKDASFNLPFTSLLAGRPEVRLQLVNPSVSVVKDKDGKMNALTLVKEQPPQGKSAQASSGAGKSDTGTSTATGGGKGTEVPAMVMNARLTFLLEHAKLDYKDLVTGDSYDVTDLNVRLEDVSPSSTMPFEVTANLDLLVQKRIKVAGPLTFDGEVKATSSGGNFDKADVKASLKLDGLEINDPGLFEKKRGVPLGAELTANAGKDSFAAPKIVLRLASVEIDAQATGKTANNATTVDFKMHSNKIDLAKLGELSPLITQYGVNGLVELSATASGPTDKLGYGATLKFNKIALSNEALKQPLEVNGSLAVATNELKDLTVKLTAAKGFDLSVNGSMQNFMAPKFRFKIASNEMDLDGLLKASEKAAQTRKEHADAQMSGAAPAEGKHATPPVVDYNAMFEPLRKIPMAAAAGGTVDFGLKRIRSTGVVIDGMSGQLALNNLAMALKDFSMKIFDGSIKGGMTFNVKPAKPEVGTSLTVAGLQTQKMVESSMPIARNTVKGAISATLNIGGSGLNQSDIIAGWKGNGSMDIKDAIFSTLDVGTQVKAGVIDKLPGAIRSKANIPDKLLDKQGKYQNVGVKFALNSGVMNINEINGKAYPDAGLDLKGNGSVKLANYGLDLTLDIIDTYNMLRLDNEVKDQRYGHFAVSPKVGGTLFEPKFDWGATLGKLLESAARQQLATRGKEELKKHLPGAAGGLLDKITGGGGGNNNNNTNPSPTQKPAEAVGKALKGLFGH